MLRTKTIHVDLVQVATQEMEASVMVSICKIVHSTNISSDDSEENENIVYVYAQQQQKKKKKKKK